MMKAYASFLLSLALFEFHTAALHQPKKSDFDHVAYFSRFNMTVSDKPPPVIKGRIEYTDEELGKYPELDGNLVPAKQAKQ